MLSAPEQLPFRPVASQAAEDALLVARAELADLRASNAALQEALWDTQVRIGRIQA